MTNEYSNALWENNSLKINLRSGESRILICSEKSVDEWGINKDSIKINDEAPCHGNKTIDITNSKWTLSFTEETPKVGETFKLNKLKTWEGLSDSAAVTMGTGVYETSFKLSKEDARRQWTIDLGDVRESARVYINDTYVGCCWAVPFTLNCSNTLKKGINRLRIEVTNLPANRIADMDRHNVKWRKMKEINVVDINYKKTTYENWKPVKSGLNGKVTLVNQ